MERIFRVLLNMSYTGALVALAILPLRFLLRKAPRWLSCALWLLPLFRFLCPVSIQSAIALLPGTEPIPAEFLTAQAPQIHTGIPVLNSSVNPVITGSLAASTAASANPAQILLWVLGWVWIIGVIAFLVYSLVSSIRLRGRLRFATLLQPGVYESDHIPTAFVSGIIHPMIYLPAGITEESRAHVLLHEQAHIRRRDYLLQPLFFVALALHWFNPFAWMMYLVFVRDMELACDESAVRHAGGDIRQAYSATLLSLSAGRGIRGALAFGQSSTKARIKSILDYKKPSFWAVAVGILAVCTAGALLLLNPSGTRPKAGIGVIGGADGPTQIYITKGEPTSTPQPAATPAASPVPTLPVGANAVVYYKNGQIERVVPIVSDKDNYFINAIIFDHMIRSAAWTGLDMKDYPDRIDIYLTNSPAAQGIPFDVFHVFMKDGKPCHQMGDDGMWSFMAQELYDELLLFGTPEFPDIVVPTPTPIALTPAPVPRPGSANATQGESAAMPSAIELPTAVPAKEVQRTPAPVAASSTEAAVEAAVEPLKTIAPAS